MMSPLRPLVALAMLVLAMPAARATPTERFASDEVSLRLIAEAPDSTGRIRAALLVDLAPGWKTYWRDPGDAGIPPTLDLSASRNIGPADIRYPAPHRFGDDYGMSNGYSAPMAIALTLPQLQQGVDTHIQLKLMMGVCQAICVPIQAELAAVPAAGAEAKLVAAAFAALPAANEPVDGILAARLSDDGKHLRVTLAGAPDPAASDLFVAGQKGWAFGAPETRTAAGDGVTLVLPVLARPRAVPPGPLTVDAILTRGTDSIEARGLAVGGAAGVSTARP